VNLQKIKNPERSCKGPNPPGGGPASNWRVSPCATRGLEIQGMPGKGRKVATDGSSGRGGSGGVEYFAFWSFQVERFHPPAIQRYANESGYPSHATAHLPHIREIPLALPQELAKPSNKFKGSRTQKFECI
jgi:hypothetical protein